MSRLPGKPPALPPLSADFQSVLKPTAPGAGPAQHSWKLLRSSDGKTHVFHGNQSLITDPAGQRAISLDHEKKQAMVLPFQPPREQPKPSGGGTSSPFTAAVPASVRDLGKRMVAGHEAEGKFYTFHPPQLPQPPKVQPPQVPGQPAAAPQFELPNAAPPQPQPPHTMEVWTSPKLGLPLASRMEGSMGQQTTICKQVTPGEPPPHVFQIPAGYTVLEPPPTHAPSTSS